MGEDDVNFGAHSNVLLVDKNAKLADSGLTTGWIVETLLNYSWEFADALGAGKVEEVTAVDISEGEGFASKVYRIRLRFSGANRDHFNAIMKVPTRECTEKLMKEMSLNNGEQENGSTLQATETANKAFDAMVLHDVECAFYDACGKIDDFPLPKVWYTRKTGVDEPGVILMEDLGTVGCRNRDFRAMKAQQIRNIVRHYAALHAHQLCLSDEEKVKWDAIPAQNDSLLSIGEAMLPQLFRGIKECEEGWLKSLIEKVMPIFKRQFADFALIHRPQELGIPLVYCQGDSGGHNIFFKKASDGTPDNEVCAFLDWQVVVKASPIFDIGRVVMGYTDAEVRRELDETLIEEYYSYLKAAVEKKDQKLGFGVAELREAYELAKINASYMPIGLLAYMNFILKGKDSPEVIAALREKQMLRVKLAFEDAVVSLRKYAPQYLNASE